MKDTWEALQYECDHCRECSLCQTRHSVVFGTGNRQAEIMLAGEGPGASEDEQGIPFVGRAGKLLDEMLEMVNKLIRYSVDMFVRSDESHMREVVALEDKVDAKEREMQMAHVQRLTRGECTPEAGMIFSDIASGLERVADHATNIAFAIIAAEREAEAAETQRRQG